MCLPLRLFLPLYLCFFMLPLLSLFVFSYIYLESWHTFDFVLNICSLFLSTSIPLSPSVLSLVLFSLFPSVFCPNWRLNREFYILAASNDERPLITVYPCRWYTAVATWDTFISFLCFSSLLVSPVFPSLLYTVWHENQSILDCGMTSTYCDLLFVKWAVNSGGIMLRHPVLWQFLHHFPRRQWWNLTTW